MIYKILFPSKNRPDYITVGHSDFCTRLLVLVLFYRHFDSQFWDYSWLPDPAALPQHQHSSDILCQVTYTGNWIKNIDYLSPYWFVYLERFSSLAATHFGPGAFYLYGAPENLGGCSWFSEEGCSGGRKPGACPTRPQTGLWWVNGSLLGNC